MLQVNYSACAGWSEESGQVIKTQQIIHTRADDSSWLQLLDVQRTVAPKKRLRAEEEDAATYRGCWRRRALSAASTIRSRPARAPMRRPASRAVARAATAAAATKVRSFLASLEAFLNSLIKKNNGSSSSASLWSCARRIWQMLKRQCTLLLHD